MPRAYVVSAQEFGLLDSDQIRSELRAIFEAPNYSPPVLPAVALEVQQLVQRPNVEMNQVAQVLEQDPVLAADFLRKVQSPIYATRVPAKTVRDALTRLGLTRVANIVLEVAMNLRVFKAKAYMKPMDRLRKHSVAAGHVARVVANHTAIATDYAFMCGLLHDLGVAALLFALGETGRGQEPPKLETIAKELYELHQEASGTAAKIWDLPPDLQYALGNHHDVTIGGYPHPLAATVCVAESLIERAGAGLELVEGTPFEPVGERPLGEACKALNLSDKDLDTLQDKAAKVLDQVD